MSDEAGSYSNGADKRVADLAAMMRAEQEASGVPLSDFSRATAPMLYVGRGDKRPTPQVLIFNAIEILKSRGLYRRGRDIGTVDEETGEFETMLPHTFVSWVPMVAGVVLYCGKETDAQSGKEKVIPSDLTVEQARLILASAEARAELPEIKGVNMVPLPVLRKALDERGKPKIELLAPGYDAETGFFTVRGCPEIDETMTSLDAAETLFNLFRTFEWSDKDDLGKSDRMAVHIACMFTIFCRFMYDGKAPFFFYHSNLEGSGKGALIQCALLPVFRRAGPDDIDLTDTKELRNVLNTKAASGAAYIWAEELPENWNLNDRVLARWATASVWQFRPMKQNEREAKADIEKVVTLIGANRVTVDRNIGRRTLHADLFPHLEARDRSLPEGTEVLDAEWFKKSENLDRLLSCMWSIVRAWDERGRPPPKARLLESFEGWSRVVPALVESAALGNPLREFVAPGAGDDDSRTMKILALKVIEAHCYVVGDDGKRRPLPSVTVTMRDIVRLARLNDLFVDRLGSLEQVHDELNQKKGFNWKQVEYVEQSEFATDDDEDEPTPKKAKKCTREPNDDEKRLQAAEYMDNAVASSWGKFFKRMAVDERWFTSADGHPYKFGDRGSSKTSKFVLRLMTAEERR